MSEREHWFTASACKGWSQSRSKGTLPGNIVHQHLLGTFAIYSADSHAPNWAGTKHIDLLQIDLAGLDLEDRMFCKHFSKNMSMVSATHCCSNCAEADLLTCRFVCHVSPDILLLPLSSSFHYFSFSFSFSLSIWFGGGTDETQIDLLRCLAVSCFSSVSVPPRDFIGITPWSASGAVAIVASIARLKELANLLSGGKLSLYFLSIGRATNCLWHNHKQRLK